MRQVAFLSRAFDQFTDWSARDRKTFDRIVRLITESARTPFTGTGKPEALKHELKGCW
jgi:toxin YoeB